MITCIIAEKPSVARDIARIVGANNKQDGFLEGSGYMVTWAMGHLITLAMPEAYGFSAYKAEDLPIRPNPFLLVVRQVRKDKEYISDPAALKQLKVIRSCFEMSKPITDGFVRKRGNPKSFKRLVAVQMVIDIAKDKFTFSPCIGSYDDAVCTVEATTNGFELLECCGV